MLCPKCIPVNDITRNLRLNALFSHNRISSTFDLPTIAPLLLYIVKALDNQSVSRCSGVSESNVCAKLFCLSIM